VSAPLQHIPGACMPDGKFPENALIRVSDSRLCFATLFLVPVCYTPLCTEPGQSRRDAIGRKRPPQVQATSDTAPQNSSCTATTPKLATQARQGNRFPSSRLQPSRTSYLALFSLPFSSALPSQARAACRNPCEVALHRSIRRAQYSDGACQDGTARTRDTQWAG